MTSPLSSRDFLTSSKTVQLTISVEVILIILEMNEDIFSRRFFYTKFLVGKKSSEETKIGKVEEYARANGAYVIQNVAKTFYKNWKSRWNLCIRNRTTLELRYKEWLDTQLYSKITVQNNILETRPRRKRSQFENLSDSQKRKRTTELRKEESHTLTFAAASALRRDGHNEAANLITQSFASPTRPAKILEAFNEKQNRTKQMSDDEALALAIDCGLTKHQYITLTKNAKKFGSDLYPSYYNLSKAKRFCYPDAIMITEIEAVVNLQSLLDHTSKRLISSLKEIRVPTQVTIYYKWGFDGSSGHNQFKQIFQDKSNADSSVVITAVVPIRIISTIDKAIIWENSAASSTRFCRPIRIAYEKESREIIKSEYERMTAEMNRLRSTIVDHNSVEVTHVLFLTMIDTKTINTLEGNNATSRCYICRSGPKDMNDITNNKFKIDAKSVDNMKYGISPLHARIKFFEFLLHVSYRLNLPDQIKTKGTRKSAEEKSLLEARKKEIQNQFKQKLGLLVDVPKPGFGSSNDGNTSRKFFENTKISSEITGIDESIINRFSVILCAINTSQQLSPQKFGEYTIATAKIVIEKYGWWPMSPTVHKVLIHGEDIMCHAIVPLGQLSEEAQEHRNKDFKNYRTQFARQHSRVSNLTDIFNRFLITSDPLITSLRNSTKTNSKPRMLPIEVSEMLKEHDNIITQNNESEEDEMI